MSARQGFIVLSVVFVLLVAAWSAYWPPAQWLYVPTVALIGLGIYDMVQRRHTILRVYPVIGHVRFLFESVRKEIQQYFVESDVDGMPVSREFRSLVYQRAKGERDTRPFGTIFDVYRDGCEWINHSLAPKEVVDHDPRIVFGEGTCAQPYAASPLNISAMSYGALSKNAIMALNKGAKLGGFAHNTGQRVFSYHKAMIENMLELLAAAGLERPADLRPHHIHHRVGGTVFEHYDEMYPLIAPGCLLEESTIPEHWRAAWGRADVHAW